MVISNQLTKWNNSDWSLPNHVTKSEKNDWPSPFTISFLIPCSKDARLPVQLQRAMAAEAEAAREARAKVNICFVDKLGR